MEKEIVWTRQAEHDFWEIVTYLKECWPPEVLDSFEQALALKTQLLQKQPYIGFKSKKAFTASKDLCYKVLLPGLYC
jgi:plasmid stabilization system protein ParE